MFIVCFGDGLGNQMCQYAFYKALQYKYPNSEIKMDIFNIYGRKIHNGFELDKVFNIQKNECNYIEIKKLLDYCPIINSKYWIRNKFYRMLNLIGIKKNTLYYQKDPTIYDPVVFQYPINQSILFRGNWTNEKYFNFVKDEILKEFRFNGSISCRNQKYLEQIISSEAVSIHVRRGDYVNSSIYNLGTTYYIEAIEIILSEVVNPQFYIFSDDKEYALKNFSFLTNHTIIEGNTKENSWIDMMLMSKCKHNIIANSTFSFWGAYLNENANKIVVAPDRVAPQFEKGFSCSEWKIISTM